MSGGEIAGIIAAAAFLVLALAVAVPLVKLGKVMDESAAAVHELTKEVVPLLAETRETVKTGNDIVTGVDRIVQSVTKIVDTVSATVDSVSAMATSSKAKTSAALLPLAKRLFERYQKHA